MPIKITSIVVDDERPAREEMRHLLKEFADLEVVGVCGSPTEARAMIDSLKPDVVFLDITMPGKDGFQMLQELLFIPIVVFVTAHEEHALRAFDHNALDYLTKPVNPGRLAVAVDRIRKQIALPGAHPRRLFLKDGISYHVVEASSIYAIESFGNYVKIFSGKRTFVQSISLKQVREALHSESFFQISRTAIINVDRISACKQEGRRMRVTVEGRDFFCSARMVLQFKSRLQGRTTLLFT